MKLCFASIALLGVTQGQNWQDTSSATQVYTHILKLNAENKFVIAQLGDLMHDGGDFTQTKQVIQTILNNAKPDLIVITGDTVDPAQSKNFKMLYEDAMSVIESSGIPWLWTGGSQIKGFSRDQVLGIDQELNFESSWSGYKWDSYNDDSIYSEDELGYFTSRIPIMDRSGLNEVFSVYAFDSEDYNCSDAIGLPGTNCIGSNAISWYMDQQKNHSHPYKDRDILFMHQPIQEFMYSANVQEVYGIKEQAINCQAVNSGLFSAALTNGKTAWIAAGGDPYNDFMTIYHGIHMSTARMTGSGPQNFSRGARIFQIDGSVITQVRMLSYSVDTTGTHNPDFMVRYPPSFSFGYQLQCGVDPYEYFIQ